MAALVLVEVRPKVQERLAEYSAAAASTIANYNGEFIHRGKFVEALAGSQSPHGFGVIRFPSVEIAKAWFASSEYQQLVPLRDQAADMSFTLYETAG